MEEDSEEEKALLLRARFLLFQQDVKGSVENERFAQIVLGFAAAAIAFFADKLSEQVASDAYLSSAVVLLCLSLLAGAAQLILAHIAAVVRSGFDNKDALASELQHLEPQEQLRLIRQALIETLETRFWPERQFVRMALAAPNLGEGISMVLTRLRRVIQWQALLYRLQLLLAALAAIPVAVAAVR